MDEDDIFEFLNIPDQEKIKQEGIELIEELKIIDELIQPEYLRYQKILNNDNYREIGKLLGNIKFNYINLYPTSKNSIKRIIPKKKDDRIELLENIINLSEVDYIINKIKDDYINLQIDTVTGFINYIESINNNKNFREINLLNGVPLKNKNLKSSKLESLISSMIDDPDDKVLVYVKKEWVLKSSKMPDHIRIIARDYGIKHNIIDRPEKPIRQIAPENKELQLKLLTEINKNLKEQSFLDNPIQYKTLQDFYDYEYDYEYNKWVNISNSFIISGDEWGNFMRSLPQEYKDELSRLNPKKYKLIVNRIQTGTTTVIKPYVFNISNINELVMDDDGNEYTPIFEDFFRSLKTLTNGWQNYSEDDSERFLRFKFVTVPLSFKPKYELFHNPKYNCTLDLIKTNQAHIRKSYIKILDDANEKLQKSNSGCTIELLDKLMPKLELNLILVNSLGHTIKEYRTNKTNKILYILAHNNHAVEIPKEFLDENKKYIKIVQVTYEELMLIKNENMNHITINNNDGSYDNILIDEINHIFYKTYQSIYNHDNALSKISDLKGLFADTCGIEYKTPDNNLRLLAVPTPIMGSWQKFEESDICVDKCNSYRSAYYYMKSLNHKYPTILQKYKVEQNQQEQAINIIKKYEGMAYIEIEKPEYPHDLLYHKNNYYVFPYLRYFIENNIKFKILFIAFSKLNSDYLPNEILEKEANLDFNKFNGSLLPSPRVIKITKTKEAKDEFIAILQYIVENNFVVQNIEFGNILKSTEIKIKNDEYLEMEIITEEEPEADQYYMVEYLEKEAHGYQRPLIYSYNLSYQQIQLINFIKSENIIKSDIVSIRTDGIRLRKFTQKNNNIIDEFQKFKSTPQNLMDKWQYEKTEKKKGFDQIFNPKYYKRELIDLKEYNILPKDKSPYLTIQGLGGTGKTYKAKKWAEKLDNCVFVSATGISAMNYKGGKTIHSLLNYLPKKENKEIWDYLEKRPYHYISHLFVDEAFRLPKMHLDKLFEDLPFTEIILLGDNSQGKNINSESIIESVNYNNFEHKIIPDLKSRRYINLNDNSINFDYLNLIIRIRNDSESFYKKYGELNLDYKRNVTNKYIEVLRNRNKIFDDLFYKEPKENEIWLCPTIAQANQKQTIPKLNDEILFLGDKLNKNGQIGIITDETENEITISYISKDGDKTRIVPKSQYNKIYTSLTSMTISKSQGYEFDINKNVVLQLNKMVTLTDLYIGMSRVRSEECIRLTY